jgi:hypothetical protein
VMVEVAVVAELVVELGETVETSGIKGSGV